MENDIKQVIISNYMPYAKATILDRALPRIDGFKPSTRRILYTMDNMGLQSGKKTKATNIVGQTMKLHPHGDQTIYATMIRLVGSNETLNVPYIEGKGNYGKVFSKEITPAASRYPEAKLAPIAAELFDGIKEDAVNMVDNFDGSMKEPELLPVKFPAILVNNTDGIAVGMSSAIPSFGLAEVCDATIGVLDGRIADTHTLMEVLGPPSFPTGGYIHCSEADLMKLGETGSATFVVSGSVERYPNKIIVREIPYATTVESIVEDIKSNMKTELKEVEDVRNLTDIKGLRIDIYLKRGANSKAVLDKICRLTDLRMKISFRTAVVMSNNLPKTEIGLIEVLQDWIDFRCECLRRMYSFRLSKKLEQEHILSTYEKIADHIEEIDEILPHNTEMKNKEIIMDKYGLSEDQAEIVLDMRNRDKSVDRFKKKMIELQQVRAQIEDYKDLISSETRIKKIIIEQLTEIKQKYGVERTTRVAEPLVEVEEVAAPVDDTTVSVVVTKNLFIKRLISLRDETNFVPDEGDDVWFRFSAKNNEQILVFTYSGACYKIPVNSIDSSRGKTKDYIPNMIERFDTSDIIFVAPAKDYSGGFNIVYDTGRGTRVRFDKVAGNRSRYKSVFIGGEPGKLWITTEDKFFIITNKRRAAYIDLTIMNAMSTRSAFKVGRIITGDSIFGVQPASRVPNFEAIELEPYTKGYCVKIKDTLW